MATLPDIDTSQVSFIGYWNAIEQGGVDEANWDPMDTSSYSNVQTVESYDNGIQGDVTLPNNGRTARYRVKTDGWVVAWIDRTEDTILNVSSPSHPFGPWDVTYWTPHNPGEVSTLGDVIIGLFGATGISGVAITPPEGNVSHFNYMTPNASGFTVLSLAEKNDNDTENRLIEGSFSWMGTKHYHAITGEVYTESDYEGESYSRVGGQNYSQTDIARAPQKEGRSGAILAKDISFSTDSGVESAVSIGTAYHVNSYAHNNQVIVWS